MCVLSAKTLKSKNKGSLSFVSPNILRLCSCFACINWVFLLLPSDDSFRSSLTLFHHLHRFMGSVWSISEQGEAGEMWEQDAGLMPQGIIISQHSCCGSFEVGNVDVTKFCCHKPPLDPNGMNNISIRSLLVHLRSAMFVKEKEYLQ